MTIAHELSREPVEIVSYWWGLYAPGAALEAVGND